MRFSYEWLILIILVLMSICLTYTASEDKSLASTKLPLKGDVRQTVRSEQNEKREAKRAKEPKEQRAKETRPRRQEKPTKRKKPQPGVFASFGSLVKDTIVDARVAYRNISKLLEDSFRQQVTTPADTMTSASGGNENGTSPAPPPPAPAPPGRQAVFDLLGKNYRGLRKLWDSELKLAMSESRKNVRRFQKELRESIRPFLQPSNNET
nr:PREDICTED: uncharacterized protein LOC109036008 [Bemisia tabaci]